MVYYYATIVPLTRTTGEIPYTIKIRGVAVDSSVNRNNWRVSEEFLNEIATTLMNKTLRINHGSSVTDVIGRIVKSEKQDSQVVFEAEIIGSDTLTNAVKEKIMNGLINSVSIGLDGEKIVCSVCGKQTRDGDKMIHDPRSHGVMGHEIIASGRVKELSLVADPAYDATKISIAASFEEAINNLLTVTSAQESADVTNVVETSQEGRPTEEKSEEKGDRMAEVPKPEPPVTKSPSLEDVINYLQNIGKATEDVAKKMAEIDARLKALEEAEEARRKAEEAEKKDEEEEKKEDAEEAEEAEEARKADMEASLSKSHTRLTASASAGVPLWAKELAKSFGVRV